MRMQILVGMGEKGVLKWFIFNDLSYHKRVSSSAESIWREQQWGLKTMQNI